jgi:hypothetical protein
MSNRYAVILFCESIERFCIANNQLALSYLLSGLRRPAPEAKTGAETSDPFMEEVAA